MSEKQYFDYFEKTNFGGLSVVDLSQRSVFVRAIKNDRVIIGDYQIRDGETSWSLAWDFYGDVDYYWIILHLNDTVDPFFSWPLTQNELDRVVTAKYGEARYEPHHWILHDRKYTEDPSHPESFEITNYAHEEIENEKKRRIKILRPEFLGKVVKEFERAMRRK